MNDATPQPAPYPDAPAPGMHAAPPYRGFSGTRPALPPTVPLLLDTPIFDRLAAEWAARAAEAAEAAAPNREPQQAAADQPETGEPTPEQPRPQAPQPEEPAAPGNPSRRTRKRGDRKTAPGS